MPPETSSKPNVYSKERVYFLSGFDLPVRDSWSETGSGGVDTQDVVSSQLLDLPLHFLQVCSQLISFQHVLDHHGLKAFQMNNYSTSHLH